MVFIRFQSLFKVIVWDPIHSPSDCCWSCDDAQNVWRWDKTFISNRWPAESFPSSMWVKKFNLQITFKYIHFSTMPNRRYSWNTKNTWCFHIYFFGQWFVKIKLKKLIAILLQDIETKWWLLFVQTRSLTLQSDPPGQHEHWPFLPDLHQKIWWKEFFLHIDQALIGRSKSGHVGVFVNYVSQRLTNPPTPSHGDSPWLVAKNIYSASILQSCWWWHKLMFLPFLYCSAQPSENLKILSTIGRFSLS